eukprot:UC1_evm5s1749
MLSGWMIRFFTIGGASCATEAPAEAAAPTTSAAEAVIKSIGAEVMWDALVFTAAASAVDDILLTEGQAVWEVLEAQSVDTTASVATAVGSAGAPTVSEVEEDAAALLSAGARGRNIDDDMDTGAGADAVPALVPVAGIELELCAAAVVAVDESVAAALGQDSWGCDLKDGSPMSAAAAAAVTYLYGGGYAGGGGLQVLCGGIMLGATAQGGGGG